MDGAHVVAYEQNCASLAPSFFHFAQAFFLERCVAHRQHLVHDQDLRLQMSRHGEGKPDVHPRGVTLDRRIQELLYLRKVDDLVELPRYLLPAHAEDRAVQIDVLPSGQLRMKTGANLQARHPSFDPDPAGGRLRYAGKYLQEGRFPRTVSSYDADALTLFDFKGDLFECPEILYYRSLQGRLERVKQRPSQGGKPVGQDIAQR